jgi:hypothetical protein
VTAKAAKETVRMGRGLSDVLSRLMLDVAVSPDA